MTHTDRLIAELASAQRAPRNPRRRIVLAIATGWIASLAALMIFVGSPLQELRHTGMASFAVKLGYTLSLGWLSVTAAFAAGRPGTRISGPISLIGLPLALLALVTALELSTTDSSARHAMLFGSAYSDCFLSVMLASIPIFGSLVWAYQPLAPTRLRLAGFLIGLSAGSAGALAFALYCHEPSAAFLLTAYTPAMLVPALAGAAAGRLLLKW